MSYIFPKNLYTDVRIEHLFSTEIRYTLGELNECKVRQYSAAFIRVYDGDRWYYASTSNLDAIQTEIDALSELATENDTLEETQIFQNFSTEKGEKLVFTEHKVSDVPLEDKISLLQSIMPLMEESAYVKFWTLLYVDEYKVKEFYNSKGAQLSWDFQRAGFFALFQMAEGDRQMQEYFQLGKTRFDELKDYESTLTALLEECAQFMSESEAVEPGAYTVILSPTVAGFFAHECFGHKSESDFMMGDEATKAEWFLGKRVGFDDLSIIDSGQELGSGYVPFDDEGNVATKTYLVKNGILTGRLHSAASAADLGEAVTGNARAINYEYEPLVRMTTTAIDNGTSSFEQLISELEDGVYVKGIMHGSGMSTFTLAPTRAYYIKDGKIGKPVRISVISDNVFESLGKIDGIANDVEVSASLAGCGKGDQFPLPVGHDGPHIRIRDMQVQ